MNFSLTARKSRPVFLSLKTAPPIRRQRSDSRQSEDRHNRTHTTLQHGQTAINANALLKYADFFDVSADYILGRCDDPQGKKYDYQLEYLKNKFMDTKEWREFVEMCFDPNSPISSKLKETLFQLAEEK